MRALVPLSAAAGLSFVVVALLVFQAPASAVGGPAGSAASTGTPVFDVFPAPSSLFDSDNAGEPSVGVDWVTGNVLFQASSSTYSVSFNDATTPAGDTWTDVSAPILVNLDPILVTDSASGRTWAGGLAGPCMNGYYSDDDSSWSPMANPCTLVTIDHQSIGAGPWHSPGSPALVGSYPLAVYYCAQEAYDACATSTDGGLTFGAPVLVSGDCGSFHGHIKVSPDGTAYLPNANCGTQVGGALSTDNGNTWDSYHIASSASSGRGFDPSVATTPNNTLYESWTDSDNHPYVGVSWDHGAHWKRIQDLASSVSPALKAATFEAMTAGDNKRAAVAFLGTTTGTGNPFASGYAGVWDLYVSYTYDGGTTWATQKITTDPVQRGCLNDGGTGATSCRNLLDFMDASVTEDGRVVVAYADGCINTCAGTSGTAAMSTDAYATIARQASGKGLFSAYD